MLTQPRLEDAFRLMAERLPDALGTVEVLLIGGSAGLLTGDLPVGRTTVDCDVVAWTPPECWDQLAAVAADVALELDLPERWLDNGAHVFKFRLLPGWEMRRREVMRYASLVVHAPARVDFIASKLLAGRDVDIDDVIGMGITIEEHATIAAAFDAWPDDFARGTIAVARTRLDAISQQETVE